MNILDKIKSLGKATKIFLISLLAILVVARIAAPHLILKYTNKALCDIDGYCGSVEDIDLSLYRGAYVIKNLKMDVVDNGTNIPFVKVDKIDISVQWKALLQGAVVAEIEFLNPNINIVKANEAEEPQAGQGVDWRVIVKDLVPLSINRLAVKNAKISYKEPKAKPPVDVYIDDIYVTVLNLNNSENKDGNLVSNFELSALALNHAKISGEGGIDPFSKKGSFDINIQLSDLKIPFFNEYIKKALKIDIQEGTFDLYTEVKAKDGQISGYAKPLIKNLEILKIEEERDNKFFENIWEGIVGLFAKAIENNKKEQIASNIILDGSLQNPDLKIFPTIRYLLRNAFIESLKPKIYNIVDFNKDSNLDEDIRNEVVKKIPKEYKKNK